MLYELEFKNISFWRILFEARVSECFLVMVFAAGCCLVVVYSVSIYQQDMVFDLLF